MYVLPGYAWDGFGHQVVVPAPYRIDPGLFEGSAAASDSRLLDLWLEYDEAIDPPL